jgi:hypothetical protein
MLRNLGAIEHAASAPSRASTGTSRFHVRGLHLGLFSWRFMQELLEDAANLPGRLRSTDGHAPHPVSGNRNQIPAPKKAQRLWLPALAISFSTGLLLAALAALLGGGLVSPVLATPLPEGTSADGGPVEDAEFTRVDCCAHTATFLQDIAVLQRSLSQFADSLAVSKARALKWERAARRLQRENAALRSPLEAPPSLEEMPEPTAASPQPRSSSSDKPGAGRIRYPATLPVSGAQPAGDWHGFSQSWHARTAGACMSGARMPGFCGCGDACVSTVCDPDRRYPDPHARMKTKHTSGSFACIRAAGP